MNTMIAMRPRESNAQVECNAPLSQVHYRLEKHNIPLWGMNVPPFPEVQQTPDAASAAATEQERTESRRQAQIAHLEQFQRALRRRVAAAAREKRLEAERQLHLQKEQEAAAVSAAEALEQL